MKKSPEINPTSSVAKVASHAGVFRGVRFSSSPVGRDERRAPLKTPAWEAIAKDDVPILDVSIVIYLVWGFFRPSNLRLNFSNFKKYWVFRDFFFPARILNRGVPLNYQTFNYSPNIKDEIFNLLVDMNYSFIESFSRLPPREDGDEWDGEPVDREVGLR